MEEEKKEINTSGESVTNNNKLKVNNTMLIIVGVLVVMSAVQVFQLQGLVSAISSGAIKANAQTSSGGAIGLPSQVGGCG